MSLQERLQRYLPLLPPELRRIFDAELAAGNEVNDVEAGSGANAGKIAIILNHPFRVAPPDQSAGVSYREIDEADLTIFEIHTLDERFSLVTAKFKPMELDAAPHGPVAPTYDVDGAGETQLDRRSDETSEPEAGTEHVARFVASMRITFDMWHDGTGYDLDALREASAPERSAIEKVLIAHLPRDWRDIEALAAIDSPAARAAVVDALKSDDTAVRREAMSYAADAIDPHEREERLLKDLRSDDLFGGLSEAIDEAAEFHPPAILDALFEGALHRTGKTAVQFAALLFYAYGKSDEPFDWDHREFFLRFDTEDRAEREAAFRDLCQALGIARPARTGASYGGLTDRR
jgi:hypothetical protein